MNLQHSMVEFTIKQLKGARHMHLKLVVDAGLILIAYLLAFSIRFEGSVPVYHLRQFLQSQSLLLAVTLTVFYKLKLYNGMYEYSSIKDLLLLIAAHSISCTLFFVPQYMLDVYWAPRSVVVIYWLLGLILIGGARLFLSSF